MNRVILVIGLVATVAFLVFAIQAAIKAEREDPKVEGVWGLLLFFVVSLSLGFPINMRDGLNVIHRGRTPVAFAVGVSLLVLGPLALSATVLLLLRARIGVRLAQVYLVANFGVALLAAVTIGRGKQPAIARLAWIALVSGLWIAYLSTSPRVKNTYFFP